MNHHMDAPRVEDLNPGSNFNADFFSSILLATDLIITYEYSFRLELKQASTQGRRKQ
jgi:hypothetical protein